MAARPEDLKATTEASPPPYDAIDQNRKSHHCFWKWKRQTQPGPATSGKWYYEDPQPQTIKFIYWAEPSQDRNTQNWAALLLVKCSDVPRLMREGFDWDIRNVIHEDGYVQSHPKVSPVLERTGKGWDCARNYFLKDLQQPPRWIAMVHVLALQYETLHRFDLDQLSPEKVRIAVASSQLGDSIYGYTYGSPEQCYNAIYDDMPMEGRWPWPRKDIEGKTTEEKAVALTKEGNDGEESSECALS